MIDGAGAVPEITVAAVRQGTTLFRRVLKIVHEARELSPDGKMNDQSSPEFEREQEDLNPHRDEERRRVAQETVARLTARGIMLTGRESPDELADLMSAVENFEQEVDDHGGDLMVDDLNSSEPDDPHFVLPARGQEESVGSYIARIDEAADHLRGHPAHPE